MHSTYLNGEAEKYCLPFHFTPEMGADQAFLTKIEFDWATEADTPYKRQAELIRSGQT